VIACRPGASRRRTLAALALTLALVAGCGGSDGDGDGGGDGEPSVDTGPAPTDAPGDDAAPECRSEVVEDEYGFEVEIEVCDDE